MPRRNNQDPQQIFEQTKYYLESHHNLPSITSVIKRLLEDIGYLNQAISSNWNPEVTVKTKVIFEKFTEITNLLTKRETPRYFFDSAILGAIKQEISAMPSTASFSAHMYPSYSMNTWGHKIFPIPVKSAVSSYENYISFIFFPGAETLEDIELDDYAFILHEIGHELQNHHKKVFNDKFKIDLEQVIQQENLVGLADKGALKSKTQKIIDELRLKWSPTDNHENWSSELINDLVALWLLGPAYFYNFANHLRNNLLGNPYEIVQSHPPLALRVEAMIKAGEKLGWQSEVVELQGLLKEWRISSSKNANNHYFTMRHEKILECCIDNTINACKNLQLPLCDRKKLEIVKNDVDTGELPNIGIDIIIAAWIVKQQEEEETSFLKWEKQTVNQVNQMIFQQYGIPL